MTPADQLMALILDEMRGEQGFEIVLRGLKNGKECRFRVYGSYDGGFDVGEAEARSGQASDRWSN
jgi:hypothetical protein